MDTPNIQWRSGVGYLAGDRGTTAEAVKDVSPFVPDTVVATENFETDPISGTGGGDLPWLATTSNPHTGARCFRSGAIANNQQSLWTFTVPATTTAIRFWQRVSSESGFDFLQVYKDSVTAPNLLFQNSGTSNTWAQTTLTITGATTIIFRYVKDGSSAVGLDTVFIDDIEWISVLGSAAVQNYEPLHLEPTENRLKVDAKFMTPQHVIVDSITGSVTVAQPVNVNVLTIPEVEIKNDTGNPVPVNGTVAVSNFPATQPVSGTVAVSNFPATQPVSGTVNIGTIPEVEVKNDTGNPVPVNGTVTANQGTSPWVVSGTFTSSGTGRDDTDDQASVATGLQGTVGRNYVYDGTNWDRQRSGGVTGMAGIAGAEAHDAPITGNPVLTAGRASVAAPTDVSADGDVARIWTTRAGRQRTYNSGRRRTGLYNASLGATTITAAADAATAGRFWLQVPVAATVFAAVRRVYFSMTTGSGLLVLTAPIFTVERFTFTGTASGATVVPMKRDSSDAANTATVRTASTGMTITAGAAGHGFQCPTALATTSASLAGQTFPNVGDEDEYIILRAGEGIVIRQATAGTALDTRIANFDIQWEEFNSTDFKVND